ncbi:MAG: HAD family hydrolase [Bacteroidota bacterium]
MILAAFDFDHTLITGDSMRAFLRYTSGNYKFWKGVVLHGPLLSAFYLKLADRKRTKEILLTYYLGDQPMDTLQAETLRFTDEVLTGMIRPAAMRKLEWHQAQHHTCILVTASLSIWTQAMADKLGLDLIATKPEIREGIFTGNIEGVNNYGPEKVERIREWLGDREVEASYAYGDSRGDREMLAWADQAFYRRFD